MLSTAKDWKARKDIVLPLRSHCLCCLSQQREANYYPTLGIIRPKTISRLRIGPDTPEWSEAQLAMLRQQNFFIESPQQELQKIPFKFYYEFECEEDSCNTHTLMCTDWEMGESYRRWRSEYGDGWEEKFRQKYEADMITKNDTHFFVGTVAAHPNRWIIIGLFYPPRLVESAQPNLWDEA